MVRHADEERIGVFERIFRELGYSGRDAVVRARITYFHQVGYYALGMEETSVVRQERRPFYTRALIGR